jgi:glutamate decarboxylase
MNMPIHQCDLSDQSSLLDIYATKASQDSLPKYRLPKGRTEPRAAYALIRDELLLDGNARQNLATFCTTWIEDEVKELMADAVDKNMIDKDEYPQTAEIESRCVHIIAELWHAQKSGETL